MLGCFFIFIQVVIFISCFLYVLVFYIYLNEYKKGMLGYVVKQKPILRKKESRTRRRKLTVQRSQEKNSRSLESCKMSLICNKVDLCPNKIDSPGPELDMIGKLPQSS